MTHIPQVGDLNVLHRMLLKPPLILSHTCSDRAASQGRRRCTLPEWIRHVKVVRRFMWPRRWRWGSAASVVIETRVSERQMERMTNDNGKRKRDKDWGKRGGGGEWELWEQAGWSVLAEAPVEPSIPAGLTSETGNLSCMLHHLPHGVLPLPSPLNRSPPPSSVRSSAITVW